MKAFQKWNRERKSVLCIPKVKGLKLSLIMVY